MIAPKHPLNVTWIVVAFVEILVMARIARFSCVDFGQQVIESAR
jgi:hypothetical protein